LWWERWAEEAVVFNELSGKTHYLNATAMAILETLEREPMSAASLAGQLYAEEAAAFLPRVEQVLAEFERLGLIEPVE
jgi:PqqD family protein of HPr-rel-A system